MCVSSTSACHLTNIPSNEHIMLLYGSDDERNDAAVNYINNGLKSGHKCIYASINAYDSESSSSISNLSSKIDNYKENIENGELKIVNFKPYYESALQGNLSPFNKLKTELEKTRRQCISEGKTDKILVFADAACFLSYNKHFVECEVLENGGIKLQLNGHKIIKILLWYILILEKYLTILYYRIPKVILMGCIQ